MIDDRLQKMIDSKREFRSKLARKSVVEKLRIVEELAERTRLIRNRRAHQGSTAAAQPSRVPLP